MRRQNLRLSVSKTQLSPPEVLQWDDTDETFVHIFCFVMMLLGKIMRKVCQEVPLTAFETLCQRRLLPFSRWHHPSNSLESSIWLYFGLFWHICFFISWIWLQNTRIWGCGFWNTILGVCRWSRCCCLICTGVMANDSGTTKAFLYMLSRTRNTKDFENFVISPSVSSQCTEKVVF